MFKKILSFQFLIFLVYSSYSQSTTWEISDAASWNSNMLSGNNAEVSTNGYISPIQENSDFTFKSTIYTSSTALQANKITFKQSPVWDNWERVDNIGPALATNAPIFLPVQHGEYYFLAQYNDEGGYHAWLSSDMQNWVHQGPVTGDSRPEGYWATTAEYRNGTFYIYYDYPNDQDPHLIIDNDLTDGVVGQLMGRVFDDPSDGSDCAVLRDDNDEFHMVYEDWTPINAREHSWDSPLGGHTSSPDGITGWLPDVYPPAVDHRTTPTGEIGTYNHPSFSPVFYDIHEPDQDAFGDYTLIKVGDHYHLFSDYDKVGEDVLRLAKFNSSSINQEFEFTGSLESRGHPDPSVGFAEGQL